MTTPAARRAPPRGDVRFRQRHRKALPHSPRPAELHRWRCLATTEGNAATWDEWQPGFDRGNPKVGAAFSCSSVIRIETGAGMAFGAGLVTNAATGPSLDVRTRSLVVHQAKRHHG